MNQRNEHSSNGGFSIEDLYEAYYSCRRNKRSSREAVQFEVDYEHNLWELYREIVSGTYSPGPSAAFIVEKPVKREVFAASFRDRVVHHLVVGKMNDLLERDFIYDSYSCRIGKGTHLGIRRLSRFMRSCSANYTRDAYVLKVDIRAFFMSIHRRTLFDMVQTRVLRHFTGTERDQLLDLCRKIILHHPPDNCVIHGSRRGWIGLPPEKSLFTARPGCGIPIGNLTSQIFANLYLTPFDHLVKHDLGIRHYGRYVDDCVFVHRDRDYLAGLPALLDGFLSAKLHLRLHRDKTKLRHVSKGITFLGTVIKPNRIYIANRTKSNFYAALERHNAVVVAGPPTPAESAAFLSSMNSYLGLLRHYNTYRLRARLLGQRVSPWWLRRFGVPSGAAKVIRRNRHISRQQVADTSAWQMNSDREDKRRSAQ